MKGRSRQVTWRERLRYRLDNALTHGAPIVLLWLSLVMLLLVVAVAFTLWLGGFGPNDQRQSFPDDLWTTLTRSLDSGAFGQDQGTRFRVATLAITIAGILAVAVLIAVVTSSVQQRIDRLRRGRSVVAERGHILVLGSSDKLPIIVHELLQARSDHGSQVVVILSPSDKVELEDSLKLAVRPRRGNRFVVRRGNPASIADLEQVRPEDAKAIIILRPERDTGDAEVVRVAVAVVDNLAKDDTTVIAEIHDHQKALTLEAALKRKISIVTPHEVVPRIAAQTLRAAGLGRVYVDLLNFEGDEFYFVPAPSHRGDLTFGDALRLPAECTVVGIAAEKKGTLCPDFTRRIASTDRLIVIARDAVSATSISRPSLRAAPRPTECTTTLASPPSVTSPSESTLFVGWNEMAPFIAGEAGTHVPPDSVLHVLVAPPRPVRGAFGTI